MTKFMSSLMSQFGNVSVSNSDELNCVVPCGDHGSPEAWKAEDGTIGCRCKCGDGWTTAPNQSFDNYQACNVPVAQAPGSSTDGKFVTFENDGLKLL